MHRVIMFSFRVTSNFQWQARSQCATPAHCAPSLSHDVPSFMRQTARCGPIEAALRGSVLSSGMRDFRLHPQISVSGFCSGFAFGAVVSSIDPLWLLGTALHGIWLLSFSTISKYAVGRLRCCHRPYWFLKAHCFHCMLLAHWSSVGRSSNQSECNMSPSSHRPDRRSDMCGQMTTQ